MKYASIRARCLGKDRKNPHIYSGLPFEGKEAFYEWALNHSDFKRLFKQYEKSGYRRRLAPSVDRINTKKGYTFDNMQWLTNHENASRGMLQRWAKFRRGEKGVFGENPNLPK